MTIQCVRKNILSACTDDVLVMYYVVRSQAGIQTVHRIKEDDSQDTANAVKQIAVRATEDCKDSNHARLG